ncbi:MAG: hypothetical protein KDH15_18350 [Rhodocyclaceae bacterium]|nr:hypothetical protein [Rhodocyclaceae bacterium]
MDSDSDDHREDAAAEARYDDEVLDASWLPRPDAPLKVIRSAARDEEEPPVADEEADAFLDAIYRNQE